MEPENIIVSFRAIGQMIKDLCPERAPQIKKMFMDNMGKLSKSPASAHKNSHCCYPGGVITHTINVIKIAEELREKYFPHVNSESLFVCSLLHYFGKIGDDECEYFLEQNDQYYNNQKGYLYKINDAIRFMTPQDRSLWWAQKYNIVLSKDEWCALRNYGGAFHRENYSYLSEMSDLEVVLAMAVQIATKQESNATRKSK